MKKSPLLMALIVILSLMLAGCNSGSAQNKAASVPPGQPAETKTAKLWPGTVNGSHRPDFETQPWEYTGELTVEILAKGLSETTGLDYFVTAKKVKDGISVDWAKDSTLVANLDDREQKEKFFFFDADSMRWFMMDSLWLTINDNLAPENVYYTMDGGKDLVFEALYPINQFPADLPYMGSAFHLEHAGGKGDLIESKPITEDEAITLIKAAMSTRAETAAVFVPGGEKTIEGQRALSFAIGENSADGQKFTALYHYAVTDSGNVYYIDVVQGADWILFDPNAKG